MAAIDKIYTSSFHDFDDFRKWVMIYYPKMSRHFYKYFMSEAEFRELTEEEYQKQLRIIIENYKRFEGDSGLPHVIEKLKELYSNIGVIFKLLVLQDDARNIINDYEEISKLGKDEYMEKHCDIPIANFPTRYDKILLWRCPISFIRDYLKKNCGYKTQWYHRIFWKGRKLFN